MVRCERYNANLTAVGCQRKKESLPPRVKNAAITEEESVQNHPCFGCLGPIIVNWPVADPPILMEEVTTKPVIVHPNLEDTFSPTTRRIDGLKSKKKERFQYIPSASIQSFSPKDDIAKKQRSTMKRIEEKESYNVKKPFVEGKSLHVRKKQSKHLRKSLLLSNRKMKHLMRKILSEVLLVVLKISKQY